MKKRGMMMVCGNSIKELEHDLAMLKMAVVTGAVMGCGGATLTDVEKGVAMLGGYCPTAHHDCGCNCCHNEVEDTAPPTIAEILDMVETGEINANDAYDLIHEYYEVED